MNRLETHKFFPTCLLLSYFAVLFAYLIGAPLKVAYSLPFQFWKRVVREGTCQKSISYVLVTTHQPNQTSPIFPPILEFQTWLKQLVIPASRTLEKRCLQKGATKYNTRKVRKKRLIDEMAGLTEKTMDRGAE